MEFYGSTHCHTDRSNFRLRDSTNRLKDLCKYAAFDLKHNFIAITDHETISTAIDCQDVETEIRKKYPDFKVIRGNEIYLCRNGLNKENFVRGEDKFYHWILLAKDAIGHQQIRELSTKAWSRCFKQGKMIRVPTYYQDLFDIIGNNPGHVIMQTACLGSKVSQMLLNYSKTQDEEEYDYIKNWIINISKICGTENFFLETQPSFNKEQIAINKLYKRLSEELNFPVVISLDAHYLKKEDEPIHHAFLTSQEGERETADFYASTYMMSREEIHSYMDDSIGYETVSLWMNNTKKIYDMCEDYDLTHPLNIPYLPLTVNTISEQEYLMYKEQIKELSYFYNSPHKADRDMAAAIVSKILSDKEQYDNEKTFLAIDECLTAVRLASDKQNTRWSAYLLNMRDYIDVIWTKGNSLVGCSRGCFLPDTKVLMSNGNTKKICEIKIGDKIVNHNGEINKVKNVFCYDIDEEIYEIKGKGKESVFCTNNHKFYIKKQDRCNNSIYKNTWCKESCRRHSKCSFEGEHTVLFEEAQNLRIGDMLSYPKPKLPLFTTKKIDLKDYVDINKVELTENTIAAYQGNNTVRTGRTLSRYLYLDEDLCYLFGVFIGDGWTKSAGYEIGFAFNSSTEKDLISLEKCKRTLEKLGFEPTIVKHKDKKLFQMKIYSSILWSFFRTSFGANTYEKHIPNWLITNNKQISISLLMGLMASDGYYGEDIICYDSVNYQLITQVQLLWASLGIFGNIKRRIHKNKNWKNSYKWNASGKQLIKAKEMFPLISTREKKFTRQDYVEDDDCFYTIIEKIETKIYKGKVYDLQVENNPSYVVEGCGVHNSGGGFALLNILDITQINPIREKAPLRAWRFLNPERVSPLDIDTDIEGGKRPQVYKALQDVYGSDRVSKVLTIRTEKSKSALITAARGHGLDPDEGAYLASFIKADRGQARTLHQTFYGDIENDITSDKTFVDLMTNKYPEVWETAQYIEGLCSGIGSHAGGVIFFDEPITNTTALMSTTNGDVVVQFDLHTAERCGLIKVDLLSIEALDRMRACLDLLVKKGYIDGTNKTLRQIYEEAVGVYNIERNSEKMWEMIHNHEIESLFQMEQQSGIKGIAISKPSCVEELSSINSIMRLMAADGGKQPLEIYAERKKDPLIWEKEMIQAGLNKEERDWCHKWLDASYGICDTQEVMMSMIQEPIVGGHSLLFSDRLRKSVAKFLAF